MQACNEIYNLDVPKPKAPPDQVMPLDSEVVGTEEDAQQEATPPPAPSEDATPTLSEMLKPDSDVEEDESSPVLVRADIPRRKLSQGSAASGRSVIVISDEEEFDTAEETLNIEVQEGADNSGRSTPFDLPPSQSPRSVLSKVPDLHRSDSSDKDGLSPSLLEPTFPTLNGTVSDADGNLNVDLFTASSVTRQGSGGFTVTTDQTKNNSRESKGANSSFDRNSSRQNFSSERGIKRENPEGSPSGSSAKLRRNGPQGSNKSSAWPYLHQK